MGAELLGEVTKDGQNSITYHLFPNFRASTSAGSVLRWVTSFTKNGPEVREDRWVSWSQGWGEVRDICVCEYSEREKEREVKH